MPLRSPSVVTLRHIQPREYLLIHGGGFAHKGGGTNWDAITVPEFGLFPSFWEGCQLSAFFGNDPRLRSTICPGHEGSSHHPGA